MSEDFVLKCLIAFVLGYFVARMIRGNGFSIGGQEPEPEPSSSCTSELIRLCGLAHSFSVGECDKCVGGNQAALKAAGCSPSNVMSFCSKNCSDCPNSIPPLPGFKCPTGANGEPLGEKYNNWGKYCNLVTGKSKGYPYASRYGPIYCDNLYGFSSSNTTKEKCRKACDELGCIGWEIYADKGLENPGNCSIFSDGYMNPSSTIERLKNVTGENFIEVNRYDNCIEAQTSAGAEGGQRIRKIDNNNKYNNYHSQVKLPGTGSHAACDCPGIPYPGYPIQTCRECGLRQHIVNKRCVGCGDV